MVGWPMYWRADRQLMERICEHEIGHPDPDDIAYKRLIMSAEDAAAEAVHGCDDCCVPDRVPIRVPSFVNRIELPAGPASGV